MANEPSWEDIFNPQPRASEPATQPAPTAQPAPLVEPPAPNYAQPVPAAAAAAAPAPQAPVEPEDPFAQLFGGTAPTAVVPPTSTDAPQSRRELREAEGRKAAPASSGGGGRGTGGGASGPGGYGKPKKKRSLLWLKITLPIVLVLGAVGGVAAFAWLNYEEQVRELLGWQLPTDYEGTGNGEEVIVTVRSGDIGEDVAATLHEAGVTMTFDAVYDILLENPDIGFIPGNWRLQKEMSGQSAIDALQNEENRVTSSLLITEGTVLPDVLEDISNTTGIPLEEVTAAASNPQAYGVPAEAPSLEGYLFPATYELNGGETAEGILQMLVNEMFSRMDAMGVPVDQRHAILTMAGLVQREAGSNPDDFYKVARVFYNRLDQGINLESDATVAYGTGNLHTVWTTDEERADASNLYNTYANPGMPIGPIGAPGERAIDAALHPADGPWLFFVPVNLATGETVFSETADQHEAAVDQLHEWCDASAENATYCE
jgi:UPF0755 protein